LYVCISLSTPLPRPGPCRACEQPGSRRGVTLTSWQVWGGGSQGRRRRRRRRGLLRLRRLFAIRRHLRDLLWRAGRGRRRAPPSAGAPAGRRSQIRLRDWLYDCRLWGWGEDPHLAFGDLRHVHGRLPACHNFYLSPPMLRAGAAALQRCPHSPSRESAHGRRGESICAGEKSYVLLACRYMH